MTRSLAGKHTGGIQGKEYYENGWGRRRGHRLVDISEEDARTIKTWIKQVLRHYRHASLLEKSKSFWQPLPICSENNWQLTTELIIDIHRGRTLEIAVPFRQFHGKKKTWNATMISLHDLSHAVLVSHFEYPRADVLSLSQTKQQTISRCSLVWASYYATNSLNAFEEVLKDSVQIVLDRLCHREWEIFEWSENYTTNIFRNPEGLAGIAISKPSPEEFAYFSDRTE
ncbi:hypothetical protein EAF04_003099 [Stromatinia cepivora]|nr:hypothetical protein EAF04_003099 [Stromatinia cepivora]